MTRMPHHIKTERLVLRLWAAEDAEELGEAVAASRYHLSPWMPWAALPPMSVADQKALILKWVDEWESGGDAILGIFRHQKIVGAIGIHRRIGPGGLEIGYWTHVDHVRKGYASEAAEALTTAAFTMPEVDHVEIHHDRGNKASAGIPRKLGYQLVVKFPREIAAPGEEGVQYTWRVDKADWAGRA